ncbi:MAG TPA: ABC transporter ATP-binding protein [Stackebrandtia sp.]|uniref:ABC transporter ATP-binding protein n=1 Tax=Stackebrandtia sp. TaxID=2023065 RepID=UPI002D2857CF|nr:ABC transporter ATP-binding protein [Stackebrandtia sp.]HZE37419.1 ABC transporter ATP-binding protein [Stackebrandtia sp.]
MTNTPYERYPVQLRDVVKSYGRGDNAVTALDQVSLSFAPATFTAVMGPSGSGKSTLLQCAAGLDRVTSGTVAIEGTRIDTMDETALTRLRRDRLGFIFQSFNLIPTLTVRQNITLPFELAGRRPARGAVRELLDRLGLSAPADRRPAELSGGQQQRVAVARALLAEPAVIFADEPTGSLDTHTAAAVLDLLRDVVHRDGRTIVMVTHDPIAASKADTVVFFADGRVREIVAGLSPGQVAARMARLAAPLSTFDMAGGVA